jgi:hypothetical protein
MVTVTDDVKESFADAFKIRQAIDVLSKYEGMAIEYGWNKLHENNPSVDFSKLYYDIATSELKEKEVTDEQDNEKPDTEIS